MVSGPCSARTVKSGSNVGAILTSQCAEIFAHTNDLNESKNLKSINDLKSFSFSVRQWIEGKSALVNGREL
jgi:hypothetical protein